VVLQALGIAAIFAVGVSLGLLGAGGTAIALPILVYLLGMEAHLAITVSILLVGAVSALGAVMHHAHGHVRWWTAAAFAPFGIAGAALGTRWCYLLSPRVLMLTFSGLLIVMAARILSERGAAEPRRRPILLVALAGFGIGVLTGVLGVGGGFLIVPAMVWIAGLDMKQAIGTSLVVIAINSAAAFYGHWRHTRDIDWTLAAALLVSALLGMTAGSLLAHRTHPARLRRWFAWLLLAMAVYTGVRSAAAQF